MNFDDRCQYANNVKTQENSEYGKSEVRSSTSRNTQCELFMSQKGFLLCESCLWCASSLYRIEDEDGDKDKDKDKISSFLQCPNCHNNKVELLPLLY
jgi:Zn-finger protein